MVHLLKSTSLMSANRLHPIHFVLAASDSTSLSKLLTLNVWLLICFCLRRLFLSCWAPSLLADYSSAFSFVILSAGPGAACSPHSSKQGSWTVLFHIHFYDGLFIALVHCPRFSSPATIGAWLWHSLLSVILVHSLMVFPALYLLLPEF